MPANLTPQYREAEARYRAAKSEEEKEAALNEMLKMIPKHKGTEKLQADLKKRLSQVRLEKQKAKQKGGYDPFHVEKKGAGQVILTGFPNTGKSSLISALTRAQLKTGEYPFTTSVPATGMMPYEDIYVQLVDTPPVTSEGLPTGLAGTLRHADALLLLIDLAGDECLEQLESTRQALQEKALDHIPAIVLGMKADMDDAAANLEIIKELYPDTNVITVSIYDPDFGPLKEQVFSLLDIIRVYGKIPGKQLEKEKPFVLKRGGTVLDFAFLVHRDFPERLKSALVWGSARFEGQAVARDYVLHDKDIVELIV